MTTKKKLGVGTLLAAILLMCMAFAPAVSTEDNTAKESQKESIGDPWFEKGDELNRLSSDERNVLAKQNETVRKMIEEDQKIKPVKVESLKDLENLPANYPEDIKKVITGNVSSKNTNQKSSTAQATTTNTVNVWIVADEEYRSNFGNSWQTQAYNTIKTADDEFFNTII